MSEAEQIARSLTVRQQDALIGAFFSERRERIVVRAHKTVLWNLCRRRLVSDYFGTPSVTDLGLQVRAILQGASS